ncbi:hypothetical protein [Actinacidiphila sp. ITFR-21]|uniref:hypothetical protein n=1 Tax=Actinacidiphila sp. ITFR-21 TaxID=3075199 RepID=UPI00288A8963|nr:hypothetical protein [Streptomyces sp. ITFR-21]WNI14642.1 hypothetical protein RLT57_03175 [Streptomyces sp. ITFR-21]
MRHRGVPAAGSAEAVLERLDALRAGDLPVRGGRTMAYVYDSGLAGLDEAGPSPARRPTSTSR